MQALHAIVPADRRRHIPVPLAKGVHRLAGDIQRDGQRQKDHSGDEQRPGRTLAPEQQEQTEQGIHHQDVTSPDQRAVEQAKH